MFVVVWGTSSGLSVAYRVGQSGLRMSINTTFSGTITVDLLSTQVAGSSTFGLAPAEQSGPAGVPRNISFSFPNFNLINTRFGGKALSIMGTDFFLRIASQSNTSQNFNSSTFKLYNLPSKSLSRDINRLSIR